MSEHSGCPFKINHSFSEKLTDATNTFSLSGSPALSPSICLSIFLYIHLSIYLSSFVLIEGIGVCMQRALYTVGDLAQRIN